MHWGGPTRLGAPCILVPELGEKQGSVGALPSPIGPILSEPWGSYTHTYRLPLSSQMLLQFQRELAFLCFRPSAPSHTSFLRNPQTWVQNSDPESKVRKLLSQCVLSLFPPSNFASFPWFLPGSPLILYLGAPLFRFLPLAYLGDPMTLEEKCYFGQWSIVTCPTSNQTCFFFSKKEKTEGLVEG